MGTLLKSEKEKDMDKKKLIRNILILIALILLLLLGISQCSPKANQNAGGDHNLGARGGRLILKIKSDTVTNGGFVYQIINNTDDSYSFAEQYKFYEQVNHKWVEVKPKIERIEHMYLEVVPANMTNEFKINYSTWYDLFKPGNYRFELEVMSDQDSSSEYLYDDFAVK